MGFVHFSRDREDKHMQFENKRSTCYQSITVSVDMATSDTVAAAQTHHYFKFLIWETQRKCTFLCWWTHTWTWAESSRGLWKAVKAQQVPQESPTSPLGLTGPTLLLLSSHHKSLPGDAGGLGTTPGGQLSTSHLAQPWLRRGNEQADKMNPSLPPEGGYFWSVLSNICRLEQGGTQAAQGKACTAVTKLQIKLSTAVS